MQLSDGAFKAFVVLFVVVAAISIAYSAWRLRRGEALGAIRCTGAVGKFNINGARIAVRRYTDPNGRNPGAEFRMSTAIIFSWQMDMRSLSAAEASMLADLIDEAAKGPGS